MRSILIKTIPGYEFYSDGRIWSEKKNDFMNGETSPDGYNRVKVNGHRIRRHKLIASVFMKNPENKTEVHHINGNPNDNRVSNLLYVTPEEHALIHKEQWSKNMTNVTKRCIEMCTMDWEHEAYYDSLNECERQTGIRHGNISMICNGKREYASSKDGKKHKFRYIQRTGDSQ